MTKKQTLAKRALSSFLALILTLTVIVTSGITAAAATSGTVTIIGAGHNFYYWNSPVTYYNSILGKNITQASGECIAEFAVSNQPYIRQEAFFGKNEKAKRQMLR